MSIQGGCFRQVVALIKNTASLYPSGLASPTNGDLGLYAQLSIKS